MKIVTMVALIILVACKKKENLSQIPGNDTTQDGGSPGNGDGSGEQGSPESPKEQINEPVPQEQVGSLENFNLNLLIDKESIEVFKEMLSEKSLKIYASELVSFFNRKILRSTTLNCHNNNLKKCELEGEIIATSLIKSNRDCEFPKDLDVRRNSVVVLGECTVKIKVYYVPF